MRKAGGFDEKWPLFLAFPPGDNPMTTLKSDPDGNAISFASFA
jgi:hypothetical protein